jgi:protein toll
MIKTYHKMILFGIFITILVLVKAENKSDRNIKCDNYKSVCEYVRSDWELILYHNRLEKKNLIPMSFRIDKKKGENIMSCKSRKKYMYLITLTNKNMKKASFWVNGCPLEYLRQGGSLMSLSYSIRQIESYYFNTSNFFEFDEISNFSLEEGNYNDSDQMPSDFFKNLSQLKMLNIRAPLTYLQHDVLYPLSNIESLRLQDCLIRTTLEELIIKNKRLTNLELFEYDFKTYPLSKQSFSSSKNIKTLVINSSKLEDIFEEIFEPLNDLESIDLSYNNLKVLPENLLKNNNKLKIFKVSNNQLKSLSENLFQNTYKIEVIDLSSNQIELIPDRIFIKCENILWINLSNNSIKKLSEIIFKSAWSVEELDLSRNKIEIIEHNAFTDLLSLKKLDLSHNSIRIRKLDNMTSPFITLLHVEVLNLSFNKIKHFSLGFKEISYGSPDSVIDMDDPEVVNRHLAVENYRSMRRKQEENNHKMILNMINNEIESIAYLGMKNNFRAEVSLNFNPVNCDCNVWEFLKNVTKSSGNIELIKDELRCSSPEALSNRLLKNVEFSEFECKLDKNDCLKSCQCFVRPETNTLKLFCDSSFNNFIDIPSYKENYQLSLYIENANLTHIQINSTCLPNNFNLTELHLRNNSIAKIFKENLFSTIKKVDLSSNLIETMDKEVVTLMKTLSLDKRGLNLKDNPIKCDCENQHFIHFLSNMVTNETLDNFHSLECILTNNTKSLLSTFNLVDFCFEEDQFIFILVTTISTVGFLIGVLLALFYKNQKLIKMWLYANNCCLWFVSEEEFDEVNGSTKTNNIYNYNIQFSFN